MKRTFLLGVLLIIMISFSGMMFAQITAEIGDGTNVNTNTGGPAPYGTWYKAFRQQYLILASELYNSGAVSGNINSVSFNVSSIASVTPMNNYRIRLKHTSQATLTNAFEAGVYSQVFQAQSYMPTVGWNNHAFSMPFMWDGVSNILVDIVTDPITGSYARNATAYYTQTTFNSSIRYQSDTVGGADATTGTASRNRSNMRLVMSNMDILDLSAISVTGSRTPSLNDATQYTVRVRNMSPDPVYDYSVKLFLEDTELASIPGRILGSMQIDNFVFEWTPTESGQFTLYGKVEMPGDENPHNDVTPGLDVNVMEEGFAVVQIGNGTVNENLPINAGQNASYTQSIYMVNEFPAGSRQIEKIAYDWNGVGAAPNSAGWTIYMGHTNKNAFSNTSDWVSLNNLTPVYQGTVNIPAINQWVEIELDTPFAYNGIENLVIAVHENTPGSDGTGAYFFNNTTSTTSRSIRFQSNFFAPDPNPASPSAGTLVSAFPNIRMFSDNPYDEPTLRLSQDSLDFGQVAYGHRSWMRAVELSNIGEGTLTLNASDISIVGAQAEMFEFDTSVFPINMAYRETADLLLYLMGTTVGTAEADLVISYGGEDFVIPLSGDVLPEGTIYVGDSTSDNLNSTFGYPTPYGNYALKFREQYLVKKEEMFETGSLAGFLNSVAFNVNSVSFPHSMPNYRIRIKETQQTSLSNSFEAGQYTVVYQRDQYYPMIGWNVHEFDVPFFWDGESNFIIEIETDQIPESNHVNATVFNTITDFNSTLRFETGSGSSSQNNTYLVAERPNMLIEMETEATGVLNGVVTDNGRALPGVEIAIHNTDFVTTTNFSGYYNFPFAPVGIYIVEASKYGYDTMTHNVNVVQDATTVQDFNMTGYPEYAIDTNSWDFGIVSVGRSAAKTVGITNPGGGDLLIQSIEVIGSDAFSIGGVSEYPFSVYGGRTVNFDIVFSPYASEAVEATVLITDNLNRSYSIGLNSSHRNRADRSPYEITLSGEGKFIAEIGQQSFVSNPNDAPNPYSLMQNGFREQYLILAQELWDMGIFPGYIDDVSFNVAALNNVPNMRNHKIRMKHTQQNSLDDTFESGNYQEVYSAATYTPELGWNTHSLSTPFLWDGSSNILVDVYSDYRPNSASSASVFYSDTNFNSTLTRQTGGQNSGTAISSRSNMKLSLRASNIVDLVALDLNATAALELGRQTNLSFDIRNLSTVEITNYNVLLLDENEVVLTSVAGMPIMPMQELNMDIPWTPATVGLVKAFARIEMANDVNPDNNDSPLKNFMVFGDGLEITTIGDGTTYNLPTGSPTPYSTWRKSFREQYLYTMEDLYDLGAAPGDISAISFDVMSVDQVVPMQNYRIRIKATGLESLTPTFETGEYTQVYQRDEFMPTVGTNIHYFDEPFYWNGWDNLLVDIVVDINAVNGRNAAVYNSDTNYVSSLKAQSDTVPGENASTGTALAKRPNTVLHIISEKMGSVAGVVFADGLPLEGVEIKLEGTDWRTVTEADGYFRFPWVPVGNYTLSGFKYAHEEYSANINVGHKDKLIIDIDLPLLPTAIVSGRVLGSDKPEGLANATIKLTGFENYDLQSSTDGSFAVEVFGNEDYQLTVSIHGYHSHQGVIEVDVIDLDLGNIVLDEIAYPASGLMAEINPRYDGIILDWNAPIPDAELARNAKDSKSSRALALANNSDSRSHVGYDIWRLASGDEENPTEWDLITANTITDIGFVDNDWLALPDGNYVWALKAVYDAGIISDPIFSNELSKSNADGVLSGIILEDITQLPIVDAVISIDGSFALESAADGSYSIEVAPGPHVVSVSHTYFYTTDAEEFVIRPSETTNLNIEMQSLPKVEISGTILASDTDEGLEGVNLSFLGFMDYDVQTDENGSFAFDIYADKDYSYTISRDGYVDITGNISVSDVDYDMGEITIYEIAYPPSNLTAEINQRYTAVDLSWNAPSIRGLSGYQLWRIDGGVQTRSNGWTLLNDELITETEFSDESWLALADGSYSWVVKAIYPAGVISEAVHSIELFKSNNDGQLAGLILDEESGSTIAGAAISLDGNYVMDSDEDGIYAIDLSPGPHVITVSHTYFHDTLAEEIIILPDETTEHDVEMQPLPRVTVSGTILASDTAEGLEGATISLLGFMDYDVQTDENGAFSIYVYADKDYSYTISKAGFESTTGEINVSDVDYDMGEITLYEIAYMPANLIAEVDARHAAVELSWDAPQIRALSGYNIWRYETGSEDDESSWILLNDEVINTTNYTDEDWLSMTDGNYNWAVKAIYPAGVISDPIFSNEIIKSNADGTLAGSVYDVETNAPLSGVVLNIAGEYAATTDENGEYQISLSPGPHQLTASVIYYHDSAEEEVVILPATLTNHDIFLQELPKVQLSGTIHGSDTADALEDVQLTLTGFQDCTVQTDENGVFSVSVYANHDYDYELTKDGYTPLAGNVEIGAENVSLGVLVLNEIAYPASDLIAEINDQYTAVELSWNAPNLRGFEGYELWRLNSGEEENKSAWISLSEDKVISTSITDDSWADLEDGEYVWAVSSIYTAGIISEPVFSDALIKSNAPGILAGIVLDQDEGTPIADASISLDGELLATSDEEGKFSIEVSPGPHSYTVSHTYYFDSSDISFVMLPSDELEHEIQLLSLPRVTLSGTVFANDTQAPLSGVEIALTGFMDYQGVSDENGEFSFYVYADNTYQYSFAKSAYATITGEVEVASIDLDMGQITLEEIPYQPSALLAEISDDYSAVAFNWNAPQIRALSGYDIWRLSADDEEDQSAWTKLNSELITDTEYTDDAWLALADGDYVWALRAYYSSDVHSEPIFSNTLTKYNDDGLFAGYITDIEDESPIAGALITIDDDDTITAITDVDGAYNLSLAPGPHTMKVTHVYYEDSDEQSFAIIPFETTTLDLGMQSLPKVLVSGSVSGTDTIGGLAGASVSITGFADYTLETDADGDFAILVYADQQYNYSIEKQGYESAGGTFLTESDDLDLGHFVLTEIAYQPSDLVATINDSYTAVELNWNVPQVRGLEGYQLWRMTDADRASVDEWSLLTPEVIADTSFEDTTWADLPDGDYLWAIRAVYTADVFSDPIFSNELYKSNADGQLAGFILDEEDDSPIADAIITVDGEFTATSDASGAYSLNLAPGPHSLSVSHTYYKDSDELNFVILPDKTTNLNIELESLPKVAVSGTVLASDTGAGLAGVDIAITGFMDYSLETDTDGSFSVLAYAGYTYDILLSRAGYDSFSTEIEVGQTDLDLGEITLSEIAYMPSDFLAEIDSRYYAVELSWNAPQIRGLLGYQIWRLKDGDQQNQSDWEILTPQSITATNFNDEDWLALDDGDYLWALKAIYDAGITSEPLFTNSLTKLNTEALLEGFVYDSESMLPIESASITIDGIDMAQSDEDGEFSISLSPGPHSIAITHTYFEPTSETEFVVIPEVNLALSFGMQPLPRVTLSGTVVEDNTNSPLAGVSVNLTGFKDYYAETDENGEFSFYVYADKDYFMTLEKPGYYTYDSTIEVAAADIDLGLIILDEIAYMPSNLFADINEDYTAVNLSWDAPQIRALSGYNVWRIHSDDTDNEQAWTLLNSEVISTGEYQDTDWTALDDGDYVWAVRALYSSGVISQPIFSNNLNKYNEGGVLSGNIYDVEDGNPIAGATIIVDGEFETTSNHNGAYSMSLEYGSHTAVVSHPYYEESEELQFAILSAQTTTLDWGLQPLSEVLVSGRVSGTDTIGGLAGASITITGFADYELETDADGEFEVLVYANREYHYTISKQGYESSEGSFHTQNADLDLGQFVLSEIAYMPSDLVAVINDSYTAVELSWNAPQVRGLEGYQIWRTEAEDRDPRNHYWDWVGFTDQTSYTDESWLDLASGDYYWIVKAQYTADVLSDPIYSNELYKSNADGLLAGFILDVEDESPIIGAIITIDDEFTAVSDDLGAYSIALAPGPHSLSVSHTYYEDSDEIDFVILPSDTTNLNVELESLPRVLVSGIVLASDTGAGLAGVDISVAGFMDYSLETDTDGSFSVLAYAGYTYNFTLSKAGYDSFSGELEVGHTALDLGEITLYETAYMPSDLTASINDTYTAVELSWNAPQVRGLEGYQIWRTEAQVPEPRNHDWDWVAFVDQTQTSYTDESWLDLASGDYYWIVRAQYTADVISDPIYSDILYKSNADGLLAGFILDEEDESPIVGAVITIDDELTAVSDDLGAYSIALAPGPHSLSVSHTYYEDSDEIDFVILPDEITNLNIELESLPRVLVSGTVLASDTGEGLAGVDISVTGFMDYSFETDTDGSFSVLAYAGYIYDFMLSKDGYESFSGEIEVGHTALNLGEITLYETAYVPSDLVATINDSYTAVELSWNAPEVRGLEGYQIWRTEAEDDMQRNPYWDWVAFVDHDQTSYTDESWQDLNSGVYYWIVKAQYTADVMSDPIYSNELYKSNANGQLAGFILNEEDESPIAGVIITVDDEHATVSDDLGAYSISLSPGPHSFSVSHTYYEDSDEIDFVILPGETTNLNIELESLPRVMVSGTVLASDTGTGLAGVDISVTGFMDYNLETDADGAFSVLAYAGYTYDFELSKAGYESFSGEIEVGHTALNLGEITLYETAYLPTDLTASINDSYTAVELSWNAPQARGLEGYQVWRMKDGDQTSEAEWSLLTTTPINATTYEDDSWLDLSDDDYLWAIKAIYTADVISDPIFSNILTKLSDNGTLAGLILDDEDNSPIAGATIIVDGEYTTVSSDTGAYTLSLAPGPHTVVVSHTYYEDSDEIDFVILPDETTNLNIELESLPRVMVSGTVLASDTGEGLAGVDISVTGFMDYNLETDADGAFSVLAYAGYTYDFELSKAGYESFSGELEVGSTDLNLGEITLYEIAYMPSDLTASINDTYTAVELSWNAPDPENNLGYQIWRLSDADQDDETLWSLITPETISTTSFTDNGWTALADGDYLWATKAIYAAGVISEPIFSDALTKSNADGILAGFILDEADDSPIIGALITVDDEHIAISDDTGAYTLNLVPGPHTVIVSHTYYEDSDELSFVILPDETTNLNIELESLPQVMVSGRIIGSDTGEGLAGVDIEVTGFMDYNFQTDAAGQFSILAYANHSYDVTASKPGYESLSGEVVLGSTPLDIGDFMLMEIAYMPTNAVAEINPIHTAVTINWNAPVPDHADMLSLSEILHGKAQSSEHSQNTRAAIGYSVWRLSEGEEDDESAWNLLTAEPIVSTQFVDEDWLALDDGSYLWAIKAVYNAGIISDALFSNELEKEEMYGTVFGYVKNANDDTPISGVLVSIDAEINTLTDEDGYYSISLLAGEYTITASHDEYTTVTIEDIIITGGESLELDIDMEPTSSSDLIEVAQTELMANYPNPFNPETTIAFHLKDAGRVSINIYNMRGQLIRKLVDSEMLAGGHNVVWDGRDNTGRSVSSGTYLYRMQSGKYSSTKKMIMMK